MDLRSGRLGDVDISQLEVVLFDLDGTLVDTIEMIRTSMRHATATVLGKALPDAVLMKNVGVPLARQMREFSEEYADELLKVYREHNAEIHDAYIAEYPGVEAALGALSERYRLGVVTSKSTPLAWRAVDHFGLRDYFELLVGSDDVDRHKPDPFPLLYAMEQLGTTPDRCAYVGDSPHDMAAALGAGALAIAALWGGFTREEVLAPGPQLSASSMAEVAALLLG